MSPEDFARWMSLYAATGVCCAIAFVLAVARTGYLAYKNDEFGRTRGLKAWLLLGPRLWWQWQKVYLTTTPVTLTVVVLFGTSMDWTT